MGLQGYCISCKKEYRQKWYSNNKQKVIDRKDAQRKRNQRFILDYLKEHPCVDCGISDTVVLEFDHLRDKANAVTVMARRGFSIENLQDEISKCEIVCANCHKRRTYTRSGSYRLG